MMFGRVKVGISSMWTKNEMNSTRHQELTTRELKDIAPFLPCFSRPFECRLLRIPFYKPLPLLIDNGRFQPHLLESSTRIPEMNIYLSLLVEKARVELSPAIWLQYLLLIHRSKGEMPHGASKRDQQCYARKFVCVTAGHSSAPFFCMIFCFIPLEGIRIYDGKIFHLDRHLDRLFRSAKALGFENIHTRAEITEAIFRVLAANGMRDGAHMRLTLTRGEKCTSSMNPLFNVYGTTLIILPEWKPTEGATTYDNNKGVSLITAGTCRRSPPSTLDNKIQ